MTTLFKRIFIGAILSLVFPLRLATTTFSQMKILSVWFLSLLVLMPATTAFAAAPIAGLGKALDFDGANDYIDLGQIDFSQGDYTIEVWFKTASTQVGDILSGANHGILIESQANGNLRYLHRQSSGNEANIYTNNAYNDNQWHHLAAIKNSNIYPGFL
jgi:hypothetical protein